MAVVTLWRVIPLAAPSLRRHCPRCGEARAFASSGRFRVNASGRRLDVWLIYKCTVCEETWNLTVHERVAPERLGARLDAYHGNDADCAEACAFEAARLASGGPAEPVPFRVEGVQPPPCEVRVVFARPFGLRLDRLLCAALNVSRGTLERLVEAGEVVLPEPRALRREATDGQTLTVRSRVLPGHGDREEAAVG